MNLVHFRNFFILVLFIPVYQELLSPSWKECFSLKERASLCSIPSSGSYILPIPPFMMVL